MRTFRETRTPAARGRGSFLAEATESRPSVSEPSSKANAILHDLNLLNVWNVLNDWNDLNDWNGFFLCEEA
jgi:hypothetical protein